MFGCYIVYVLRLLRCVLLLPNEEDDPQFGNVTTRNALRALAMSGQPDAVGGMDPVWRRNVTIDAVHSAVNASRHAAYGSQIFAAVAGTATDAIKDGLDAAVVQAAREIERAYLLSMQGPPSAAEGAGDGGDGGVAELIQGALGATRAVVMASNGARAFYGGNAYLVAGSIERAACGARHSADAILETAMAAYKVIEVWGVCLCACWPWCWWCVGGVCMYVDVLCAVDALLRCVLWCVWMLRLMCVSLFAALCVVCYGVCGCYV